MQDWEGTASMYYIIYLSWRALLTGLPTLKNIQPFLSRQKTRGKAPFNLHKLGPANEVVDPSSPKTHLLVEVNRDLCLLKGKAFAATRAQSL